MSKRISKGDVYRKYIFDEMTKREKGNIKDIEKYVDALDDHKAKKLCHRYSHYRNDYVYSFISKGPEHWIIKTVDISRIYTGKIHGDVDKQLRRNGRSLEKISRHKDIPEHKEFKGRGEGDIHPRSLSIIADKMGSKYRVIDGNHRIIKLACEGKKEFKLIFYKN